MRKLQNTLYITTPMAYLSLDGETIVIQNEDECLGRVPLLNRGRTVFPNAMGLTKALYLATWELTEKWTLPVRNWGQVYAELTILYPGRLSGD